MPTLLTTRNADGSPSIAGTDGQPGTQQAPGGGWSGSPPSAGEKRLSGPGGAQPGSGGWWTSSPAGSGPGGPGGVRQGPPQQGQPGGWTSDQMSPPLVGAGPAMQPASLNRSDAHYGNAYPAGQQPARRRRRSGRALGCALLVLVLLIGGLAGGWFWGARPYLHNLVLQQLDLALSTRESQIELSMGLLPPGAPLPAVLSTVKATENAINADLSTHNNDQVQNLHMSVAPTGLALTFTSYGQNCTILATPTVINGVLQVTNVQVQGVLAFILSSDELTSYLDNNLQNFNAQLSHKVSKITLLNQEVDVQFS